MEIVLLVADKEESLVLANRAARGESEDIVAENRLRNAVQPIEIGNRIKALRLVAPQQSAMEIVSSRLRHQVEHGAAGASKLDAEVTRLN
jgi:hypothetical protein